jgi:hypothetical protein
MSSPNQYDARPATDAEADAKDADAFYVLDIFITTTELLRHLADQQPWRTVRFSVSDVMTLRRALRTSQQSLNLIESELDKRE